METLVRGKTIHRSFVSDRLAPSCLRQAKFTYTKYYSCKPRIARDSPVFVPEGHCSLRLDRPSTKTIVLTDRLSVHFVSPPASNEVCCIASSVNSKSRMHRSHASRSISPQPGHCRGFARFRPGRPMLASFGLAVSSSKKIIETDRMSVHVVSPPTSISSLLYRHVVN